MCFVVRVDHVEEPSFDVGSSRVQRTNVAPSVDHGDAVSDSGDFVEVMARDQYSSTTACSDEQQFS
jgi:hypothetical protein